MSRRLKWVPQTSDLPKVSSRGFQTRREGHIFVVGHAFLCRQWCRQPSIRLKVFAECAGVAVAFVASPAVVGSEAWCWEGGEGPEVAGGGQALLLHIAVVDERLLPEALMVGAALAYALSARALTKRIRSSASSASTRAR
jgi:hypothetical protein